jgi:hypothetical protein
MICPSTTLLKQTAGLQDSFPETSVHIRPSLERFAALGLDPYEGFWSLAYFLLELEYLFFEMTNRRHRPKPQ